MTKLIVAGILGGIILFIWGTISWMVLPWHKKTMHEFTDQTAVSQVIQANAPTSGIYFSPSMKQKQQVATTQQIKPPMIFAAINLKGMPATLWPCMIAALITQVIAAFLVAWLLMGTAMTHYICRVGFVVVFALAAGIVTHIPNWIWFRFSTDYTVVAIADLLIGWFLAGLVIAMIVPSRKTT